MRRRLAVDPRNSDHELQRSAPLLARTSTRPRPRSPAQAHGAICPASASRSKESSPGLGLPYNLAGMPVVENPNGTLWLDVDELSEVDGMRSRLTKLGVRVTALVLTLPAGLPSRRLTGASCIRGLCPETARSPG